MGILDNLTDLEREQLRYIAEHVEVWPEGHDSVWVTSDGRVVASDDSHEYCYQIKHHAYKVPRWPTYSPDFTRAQYDAMKAEMADEAVKCCGNPSQCWEPCGDLGNSEEHVKVSGIDLPPMTPKTCNCSMRTRLVGDGCEVCNPDLARAIALDNASDDAIDYRAHCEALAGLLEVAACPDNCIDGAYHGHDGEAIQCQFCYERTEALTRWKEDSK